MLLQLGCDVSEYYTLFPLTEKAVLLHLTGSGRPHARVLLRVPMDQHHTVSLGRGSDVIRTGRDTNTGKGKILR